MNDAASREKMTGVTYCSPLVSEEDDTSEISDDTNQDEDSSDYDAPAGAGTAELAIGRDGGDLVVLNNDQARLNNVAIYASTGKNVSSNLSDSLFSSNAKDGFQLFGTNNNGSGSKPQSETGSVTSGNGNRRAFKSRPKKAESEKSFDVYDSSDDTSRNTLDLIIPPPKDFTGKNNPFHQPATAVAATTGPNGNGSTLLVRNNETKDLMHKASTSNVSHRSSNLVNGELRVARIVKRRLSARDILNGAKIKRRKFRKSSVSVKRKKNTNRYCFLFFLVCIKGNRYNHSRNSHPGYPVAFSTKPTIIQSDCVPVLPAGGQRWLDKSDLVEPPTALNVLLR